LDKKDKIWDLEGFETTVQINKDDKFNSLDRNFKNKKYKSYVLIPKSGSIVSMEIIILNEILIDVIGAKIS
jgi:hypothetical protein